MSAKKLAAYQAEHGRKPFSSITGKRKAPRKVSAKQREKIEVRRKIRERWWADGNRACGICDKPILTFAEMVNDHITPGSGKDDSEANQQPAHSICNLIKGSRRDFKIHGGQ